MNTMKLDELYYFKEAAKYQSMSVAAEKNYISQPALSSAVSRLEKRLDVVLFYRTRHGVELTKEGSLILEKINDIFSSLQEIEEIASEGTKITEISLSASSSICEYFVPILLDVINERSLPFSLSVCSVENYMTHQNVLNGISRFGIARYNKKLLSSSLIFEHLFFDDYVVYVGPKSPLWDYDSVSVKDVVKEPYIAYEDEFLDNRADWSQGIFQNDCPKASLRCNNANSIRNIILHNNYVALYPAFMAKQDLLVKEGKLKALYFSDCSFKLEYGYIRNSHYKCTPKETDFLKLLTEFSKNL